MGAMLGAIKALTEENIRLTREVLTRVAELQAAVADLPAEMREQLIEVEGLGVRVKLERMAQALSVVHDRVYLQKQSPKSPKVQLELQQNVLDVGRDLPSVSAVPYGVGPVAAICAPLALGMIAKAYELLDDRESTRLEVKHRYLPWLRAIVDPMKDMSVAQTYTKLIKSADDDESHLLKALPESIRTLMGDSTKDLLAVPANGSTRIPLVASRYILPALGTKGRLANPRPTNNGQLLSLSVSNKYSPADGPVLELAEVVAFVPSDEWKFDPAAGLAGGCGHAVSPEGKVVQCKIRVEGHSDSLEDQRRDLEESAEIRRIRKDIVEANGHFAPLVSERRRLLWVYSNLLEETQGNLARVERLFGA